MNPPIKIAQNSDDSERGALVPVKTNPPKERKIFAKADDYLNNIADYAQRYKEDDRMERLRTIVKMRNYCIGNQIGIVNDAGIWINKKSEGDGIYFDPQLATFIDMTVSQIVKSKPKYSVKAKAEQRIEKREGAKCGEVLLKQWQTKHLTAKKLQKEVKWNLLLAGESYRYTFFDPNKEGYGIPTPVYNQKQLKPKSKPMWICPICTKNGEMEEMGEKPPQMCPDCNVKADLIKPEEQNAQVLAGYQYKNIGDCDSDFPDVLEMTVIGADDDIKEALVVQRDRIIPRCVLEMLFPDKVIETTVIPKALEYQQALKNKQENSENLSGTEQFENMHFQETWLNPAVYHAYVFPNDTRLANGQTIPAGTKAIDLFPNGLYYARCGKTILNLYEQAIRDCWSHTVNSIGAGFHGVGEWDLMELQDQKNEARSMQLNSLFLDSTSPLMFRSQYTDGGKFPNKFGALVPLKDVPNEVKLQDVAARVPPAGGIPEAYAMDEKLESSMQQRIGAFTTSGDAPDVKAMGTATGIAAVNEHTIGRRAPMLQLRAEMEIEQAYQILELRQKYWVAEMYESIAKEIGADAIEWFRQLDIRRDIEITVEAESWMPQTETQKRVDFQEYLQLAMPFAQADPEKQKMLLKKAGEIYRGFDLDNYQSDETEARVRLEKLIEVAERSEAAAPVMDETGFPNPMAVAAVLAETAKEVKIVTLPTDPMAHAPLDVTLDRHEQFFKVYTEWFKSSEGREKSLFVRAVVRTLCQLHTKAQALQQGEAMANEVMAQAPAMEAQAAVQNQQMAMQNEQQQAQMAQEQEANAEAEATEMGVQAIEKSIELDEKDKDREEKEKDRQHQLRLKQMEIEAKERETKKETVEK